jgi:hypothetical protein
MRKPAMKHELEKRIIEAHERHIEKTIDTPSDTTWSGETRFMRITYRGTLGGRWVRLVKFEHIYSDAESSAAPKQKTGIFGKIKSLFGGPHA